MRGFLVLGLLVLLAGGVCGQGALVTLVEPDRPKAGSVAEGDSLQEVVEALGEPKGRMRRGAMEILQYDRGYITMVNGRVEKLDLMTQDELRKKRVKEAQLKAERATAAAAARQRRITAGTLEKGRVERDPSFATRPPRDQLAFWLSFQERYPEINVAHKIAPLQARVGRTPPAPDPSDAPTGVDGGEPTTQKSEAQILDEKIAAVQEKLSQAARARRGIGTHASGARRRAKYDVVQLQGELAVLKEKRAALP